jgi:hypothetical protein
MPRSARLLATLFLLTACESAAVPGTACERSSECAAPLACRFGRCRAECVENRDCGEEQSCLYGADHIGACTLDIDLGCETGVGRECATGLVCANDRCVSTCRSDADCPSDGACRFATAVGIRVCVDVARHTPVPGCTLVTDVCVGDQFACALRDGGVICWGDDSRGQHGDLVPLRDYLPSRVVGPNLAALDGIVAIGCGGTHACALDASGDVLCWGGNDGGQLGDPALVDRDVATFVQATAAGPLDAVELVIEGDESCARSAEEWRCWGGNMDGEIDATGIDLQTPTVIPALTSASDISFGPADSCRATSAGVSCQGNALIPSPSGLFEELGNATALAALAGVTDLGLGAHHSCALSATNTWCWGDDTFGQLGDGAFEATSPDCQASPCSFDPLVVSGGPFERLVSGAAADTICAISAGALWCWGANNFGEVAATLASTPAPLRRDDPIGEVCDAALGRETVCALVASPAGGDVYCWGENSNGQLAMVPDGAPHPAPALISLTP